MDEAAVQGWFGEYLDVLASCGRGQSDIAALLAFYGVPMSFSTDDTFDTMTNDGQVTAFARQQIDGMRATDYHHSEVLTYEMRILNSKAALYTGTFARLRSDGGEISRLTVTYLLGEGATGPRISALAIHRP